jgi:alpha-glucuronidase
VINSAREELLQGLGGLLGKTIPLTTTIQNGSVIAGTSTEVGYLSSPEIKKYLKDAGNEGYFLFSKTIDGKKVIIITGNTDVGVLYGIFNFLRLIQTNQPIDQLKIVSSPAVKLRLLNHWDNLNRTVERGYAGFSIWNWHTLPGYIDHRYKDYARANASIGINGTVLTNVNANATFLTRTYLEKVAALATLFRAYGIKVYLTARFSAPIEIGGFKNC